MMTTYQLQINENAPLGKSIIALLKSAPDVVSLRKFADKALVKEEDTELYRHLDSAFKDVKLMIDGKKEEKTLDELINELRNSND
jgi:hypothetical protein